MSVTPISPPAAALVDAMALDMLSDAQAQVATTAPPGAPLEPGAPPPAPTTPPSTLAAAAQAAAPRQDSVAPLLAELASALQSSELPAPVQAAAARALATQPPLPAAPSADRIRQALAQSGLLLEARIAADGAPPPADLKAALLVLRQALQSAGAPAEPGPPARAPAAPPPYRDAPLAPQPPLPATTAAPSLTHLARQADAALARLTLMQLASAPAAQSPSSSQSPHWRFDAPLAAAQVQTLVPFEIGREDASGAAAADGEPTWRARFSIHLGAAGPVHARISLRAGRARVSLWAEDAATAEDLAARQDSLTVALLGDDLLPQVRIAPGGPNEAAAAAGRFLDKAL